MKLKELTPEQKVECDRAATRDAVNASRRRQKFPLLTLEEAPHLFEPADEEAD